MADHNLARMRDLRFRQLLVFEQVATLGSMHKAAEATHMSQPNVVKVVRQLEELFEVPLFERHSKGVRPTAIAERLLDRIRPILGDARAMSEELVALRSGEGGQVAVGTLISASAWLLPESVALMKQRHPGVGILIREATNDILFPMLQVGVLFEVPIHVRVPFGTIGYSLRAGREPVPAAARFLAILKEVGARAQGPRMRDPDG